MGWEGLLAKFYDYKCEDPLKVYRNFCLLFCLFICVSICQLSSNSGASFHSLGHYKTPAKYSDGVALYLSLAQ